MRAGAEIIGARAADGVRLALHRFAPAGRRRAVCLCTHAMMASGRTLRSGPDHGFAGHLSRAGIETFVLDWRGHGSSQRRGHDLTDWSFDDYVRLDLPAAVAAVADSAGVAPGDIVYMGHSLGGLVALAALGSGGMVAPRGLGLWATGVWLPGGRGSRARRWLMELYAAASRPLGYAPIRTLGLGSDDEPRGYVGQLAAWARTGAWTSRDGRDYLAGLARISVPVFAACGDGDPLCRPADAEALRSRLRGARPLRRVGVRAGDALDPGHMALVTERALAPVWNEFIDFALDVTR